MGMENLTVPSCHKFIKTPTGEPDYQRIYSVAVSAYQTKYPNELLKKDELFRYLQMSRIIPQDLDPDRINLEHVELCFTIISQFQCNAICQLCPYSSLYRNTNEKDETLILGYALKTWDNLQRIKASGVKSRMFRAMIPVSEKSKVMVVPLNRLSFEYLETIPKSQEDMLSITDKIISLLRQNNQSKLSAADFKIAKKYLDNLYNGNYSKISMELLDKAMRKAFNLGLQVSTPVAHIDGFLSSVNVRSIPKTPVHQREKKPKEYPPLPKPVKELKPVPKKPPENKENKQVQKDQNVLGTYTVQASKGKEESVYLPWRITKQILIDKKTIFLSQSDSFDQNTLRNDLLLTPLLPMEIIYIADTTAVLFMANHKLYCYERNNPVILDLLLPYITASSYRKILCYDSILLYKYFAEEQVYDVAICGLNLYFSLYESLSSLRIHPAEALSKICKKHKMEFPDILNLYKQTQLVFERNLAKDNQIQCKKLRMMERISKILGYSEASRTAFLSTSILSSYGIGRYSFNYKSGVTLKGEYIAITYFIHWNDQSYFPITEMLAIFSENIIFRKGSAVLYFDNECVIFAVRPEHRDYLCDLVNETAYQIGNSHNKLPVSIDEKS